MTEALEKVFQEVAKLPADEQNAFAAWLLKELSTESAWKQAFAASPDGLERLAQEALAEHEKGQTRPLDPDSL